MNYRIVSVRLAEAKDIKAVPVYEKKRKRKVGDHLIGVIKQSCWAPDGVCVTYDMPATYTLRRFGQHWRIIDLYTPWY